MAVPVFLSLTPTVRMLNMNFMECYPTPHCFKFNLHHSSYVFSKEIIPTFKLIAPLYRSKPKTQSYNSDEREISIALENQNLELVTLESFQE